MSVVSDDGPEPSEPLSRLGEEGQPGQLLRTHQEAVRKSASEKARHLPMEKYVGSAAGNHDGGKARPAWQEYLRKNGVKKDGVKKGGDKEPHSHIGSNHLWLTSGKYGIPAAYMIRGHHSGLHDWAPAGRRNGLYHLLPKNPERVEGTKANADMKERWEKARDEIRACMSGLDLDPIPKGSFDFDFARFAEDKSFSFAFWIRMMFSALVDADCLDAEEFANPEDFAVRNTSQPSLSSIKRSLDIHLADKAKDKGKAVEGRDPAIHSMRQSVLDQCRRAGRDFDRGLAILHVPTGLGKTLSGLAFALEHAIARGLDRVIVVTPFLAIVEQTVDVLVEAIGRECILEHHGDVEEDTNEDTDDDNAVEKVDNRLRRMRAENWDSRIVVTTSVQFFESLYAAKPSRCRKLHNITNAVVIIDEAQSFPSDCVACIVHAIDQLVRYAKTSVVLSTATQPSFHAAFRNLIPGRNIIEDPKALEKGTRRFRLDSRIDGTTTPEEVAYWMAAQKEVLTIVDDRLSARRIFELVRDGGDAFHLSTSMCAQHRRTVLGEIKKRLLKKNPVRVVSTRLVEAGVDLDFAMVIRELAGLDSIIQAGGRCNREGLIAEGGILRVFEPPSRKTSSGYMQTAKETTRETWRRHPENPLGKEAVDHYFHHLYYLRKSALDGKDVLRLLAMDKKNLLKLNGAGVLHLQFREAAEKFRMVDDNEARVVVFHEDEGRDIARRLSSGDVSLHTMRRASKYMASMPRSRIDDLVRTGIVMETASGIHVQVSESAYDGEVGWVGEAPAARREP